VRGVEPGDKRSTSVVRGGHSLRKQEPAKREWTPQSRHKKKRLVSCAGCGGPPGKIYLKREDLLHTGAHKITNTLGQMLLAKRMTREG